MDGQSTCYPLPSQFDLACRGETFEVYAAEIQEKTPADVEKYYRNFEKKWKTLQGSCWPYFLMANADQDMTEYSRIATRITDGETKRSKRDNLEFLLGEKVTSVRYPMQELELNYPTTKGKVYSEEEDRYLLCRLFHYGMQADDVYERIKKDITEFPVFRFDWFFKSRSPQELQRRCTTLLGMIEKEAEARQAEEAKAKGVKGKVGHVSSFPNCIFSNEPSETHPRRRQEGVPPFYALRVNICSKETVEEEKDLISSSLCSLMSSRVCTFKLLERGVSVSATGRPFIRRGPRGSKQDGLLCCSPLVVLDGRSPGIVILETE